MNASYATTDLAFTEGTGWPFALVVVAWSLLFLAWLIPGCILILREISVDTPNRIPQFYGFTVCLIALVLGLMSLSSLINSAFERMNPLQSGGEYGQWLSSFEAYQARRATTPSFGREVPTTPDTASEATLRARYDALAADQVASVRYQSAKAFVTEGLFLLIAVGLFGYHWRWMRRLNAPSSAG